MPNLKEEKGVFGWLKVTFVKRCEEEEKEKGEENGAIFRNTYLANYWPISFKFVMYGCIYGGHKVYEFDRNRSSGY